MSAAADAAGLDGGAPVSVLDADLPIFRTDTPSAFLAAPAAPAALVAAVPWTVLAVAGRDQAFFLFASGVFSLGCVGGLVFSAIRGGCLRRADPSA